MNEQQTDVIFKNTYFKWTIVNSVFEYLKNITEVDKTLDEMHRVTQNGIYIGNIRQTTREERLEKHKYEGVFTHLIIEKEYFINKGYIVVDSLYDPVNRYDAYLIL